MQVFSAETHGNGAITKHDEVCRSPKWNYKHMQTHTLIDTVLREGDRFFKIYHVLSPMQLGL